MSMPSSLSPALEIADTCWSARRSDARPKGDGRRRTEPDVPDDNSPRRAATDRARLIYQGFLNMKTVKIIGRSVGAWPVAVTAERGSFHRLADGMTWRALDDGKYAWHADAAFVAAEPAL
jgi:hypothetical protein